MRGPKNIPTGGPPAGRPTTPPGTGGSGGSRAWWQHPLTVVLSVGLVLSVASGVGVVYQIQELRAASQNQILPGAVVNGVDLAGMNRQEALDALRETMSTEMKRTVTLRLGSKTRSVTPRELGARANVEEVVDEALQASREASWETLMAVQYTDGEVPYRARTTVEYPDEGVTQFVKKSAPELRHDPVDAELDWTESDIEVTPGQTGKGVDVEATAQRMRQALRDGGDEVEAKAVTLQPERTTEDFNQVLLLRQTERKLHYFVNGQKAGTYTVAVGTGGYPTPTGTFHVSKKRPAPTWVNPDPSGWGAGMPASIPPGPDNPLGLRALNWSPPAWGIRFHGTSNTDSLGQAASHGCVRLSNEDIVELYDKVDEGAMIVSTY